MRRTFATLLLLALSAVAAHARQGQPAPAARLIDSFGEILLTDLKARLDNFAIELQNDPAARGYVVVYAAKNKFPGWAPRRARVCVGYLVNTRGIDAARVVAVNAGLRDDTLFELWAVPAGAEPPAKPFDSSLLMSGERTPLPFDRFDVIERGNRRDLESASEDGDPYPDSPFLYEYLAEVLRSDPALRACVIGYTSRHGSPAAARRIAERAKLAITKSHAVDVRRVVALGGGRREYKAIELWLVPPGAALPKPTPAPRGKSR